MPPRIPSRSTPAPAAPSTDELLGAIADLSPDLLGANPALAEQFQDLVEMVLASAWDTLTRGSAAEKIAITKMLLPIIVRKKTEMDGLIDEDAARTEWREMVEAAAKPFFPQQDQET